MGERTLRISWDRCLDMEMAMEATWLGRARMPEKSSFSRGQVEPRSGYIHKKQMLEKEKKERKNKQLNKVRKRREKLGLKNPRDIDVLKTVDAKLENERSKKGRRTPAQIEAEFRAWIMADDSDEELNEKEIRAKQRAKRSQKIAKRKNDGLNSVKESRRALNSGMISSASEPVLEGSNLIGITMDELAPDSKIKELNKA